MPDKLVTHVCLLYKVFCRYLLLFVSIVFTTQCQSQSFLRANNKEIVNEKKENILFKGIGLGGWMLQEGYMLHIEKDGQQHKIREKFIALAGVQKTTEFYESWLNNFIQKNFNNRN